MGCSNRRPRFKKIKELDNHNILIYCDLDKKEYDLKIIRTVAEQTIKFNNEIKILKKFNHPNIIKLKGVFISSLKKNLYIITEYADDGDLQMKLDEHKRNGEHFQENQIIDWLMQICLALEYIHEQKVIHRNIKPSSIFCMKKGFVKLGDFGIAKLLENPLNKTNTFINNNMYLAPEIINKEDYSFEVDIWDLGITFYQLMFFQFPFEGKDISEIYDNILEGKKVKINNNYNYSPKLIELINKMISKRKEERPTLEEILKGNLFKSRKESYLIENEFVNEKANWEIENYENKNKRKIKKEINESVLLETFEYDDEDNYEISTENEKLNEEKNYQFYRVMTLINEKI